MQGTRGGSRVFLTHQGGGTDVLLMQPLRIELYDAENIDTLSWPDTARGRLARRVIGSMVRNGIDRYVSNARARVYVIAVEDIVLPVVVVDQSATSDENTLSVRNRYVRMNIESLAEAGFSRSMRFVATALLNAVDTVLRVGFVDNVVFLDHWLAISVLGVELSVAQLQAVTSLLAARFPEHAIVRTNVDPDGPLLPAVRAAGYELLFANYTTLMPPTLTLASRAQRKELRSDLASLNKASERGLRIEAAAESDIPAVTRLYLETNFTKHPLSRLAVLCFTDELFRLLLAAGRETVHLDVVRAGGSAKAFILTVDGPQATHAMVAGHDEQQPRQLGLYRAVVTHAIRRALRRGVLLDAGPGVPEFKRNRGAHVALRYWAVYVQHLTLRGRTAWHTLRTLANGTLARAGLGFLGYGESAVLEDGLWRLPSERFPEDLVPMRVELRHELASAAAREDAALPALVPGLTRRVASVATILGEPTGLEEELARLQDRARAVWQTQGRSSPDTLVCEALEKLRSAPRVHGVAVVVASLPGAAASQMEAARNALVDASASAAVLLVGEREGRVAILCALTPDVVARSLDAGELVRTVAPLVGGRGGGRAASAQGGGTDPNGIPALLAAADEWIRRKLAG